MKQIQNIKIAFWENAFQNVVNHMGPLLLTWFNFNPSMDM